MSKTVYDTHPLDHGCYFDPMIVPDAYVVKYPVTDIEPDKSLQVAKFDPATQTWHDASEDAQAAKDLKRDQDLATAQATIASQAAKIADLKSQLAEAQDAIVELAQATLPSTDATDTEAK
ncbi:hypothetical protein [Lacticaseibacillus sp. N501-2]|uniref:hypothetical protein n=1 Tax=Lacticaseibacillus salsurae TaxID=3367729 RepID=UPI0038B3E2F9